MRLLPDFGFGRREVRGVSRGTRDRVDEGTRAIVVGGGLAGVSAACVLAEKGVQVTLIEAERYLGGRAGAWTEHLADGTPFEMERGFHAFFRHYYNLRNLMRRVDPELSRLRALEDYPILGPDGAIESFAGLPTTPPLNLMALLRRTSSITLADLRHVDRIRAQKMLQFDARSTYAEHDSTSAKDYLDGLGFPARGRQMLFDVFAHSFFNPEEEMSAAEVLMMFHFYFLANPEGLVFDVLDEPFSDALWKPMERYLTGLGVTLRLGESVESIRSERGGTWRAHVGSGEVEAESLVLAVSVPALKGIAARSPDLTMDKRLAEQVDALAVTRSFAIWRLFLDRAAGAGRAPFVGTAGVGELDNISLYERFEGQSRRWSMRTGGSVVELHAYALEDATEDEGLKARLRVSLDRLYPELEGAAVLHERYLRRADCPAFAPGSHAARPRVATGHGNVALAGDFVKLPFPTALMERAAASGMLAANHLLDRWDVRGEALYSVPPRGVMASLFSRSK